MESTEDDIEKKDSQTTGETKERKLYLTGMTCVACEKLISRVVTQNGAKVGEVDAKHGTLTLVADDTALGRVKQKLAERGFKERKEDESPESGRGDMTRVKDYILSMLAGEPHVAVEAKLTNHAFASAVILMGLGILSYGSLLKGFGSSATTVSLLLLVIATSVMTIFSYYHMSCYRRSMSCMHGMMIGMTVGMMSGFMTGAIIGATNGIFIGSVVGVTVGIGFGFAVGRFCGVMGAMEGIMAGLMSGTMGAMTTVMMINDNMIAFMYLLMGVCGVSMASLSYMMSREAGPAPNPEYSAGFGRFFLASAMMSVLLLVIMLYGPRGAITFIR
jgi:copper chaperone CopZ